MIKTVGIVGMGALGALYANELLKGMDKDDLFIIVDADRKARYESQGIYANGTALDLRYVSPAEAQPLDLLLFMTKYPQLADGIELARPFCGENTIILSFLNGVSSEALLEEKLPDAHVLYCCVQGMDATRDGTRVFYSKAGYVAFSEMDNSTSPAVEAVDAFFTAVGLAHKVPQDIRHQMYSKWMLNVGVNQTCAAYDVDYDGVQSPGRLRSIMLAAMEEARLTANAEGVMIAPEEVQYWVDIVDGLAPDGKPSMRQDVLAGRGTEVALFAGTVCALGHKHGISVPQNEEFLRVLR